MNVILHTYIDNFLLNEILIVHVPLYELASVQEMHSCQIASNEWNLDDFYSMLIQMSVL